MILFQTLSLLHYLLHTIIKRNIAYTQNYTIKCKKCFVILKKYFCFQQGKSLATLSIFIVKWISNDHLNAKFHYKLHNFPLKATTSKSFDLCFTPNMPIWNPICISHKIMCVCRTQLHSPMLYPFLAFTCSKPSI